MFNLLFTKLSLRLAGHNEGSVGASTRRQKLREKIKEGILLQVPPPFPRRHGGSLLHHQKTFVTS